MPVTPTYPGVYIQEQPSGVHPIIGVATSITAFVGRTQRGPVGIPTTINAFADFERIFGGLDVTSQTSYAVRDFFLNGGSQAIIVRLIHNGTGTGLIAVDNVKLQAASQGKWGANLRLTVDATGVLPAAATQLGVPVAQIFKVTIQDASTGATETYPNVTLADSARRLDTVLQASSQLVRWQTGVPINPPLTPLADPSKPKSDDISTKAAALDAASKAQRTAWPASSATLAAAEQALAQANAALAAAIAAGKTGADLKPFQDDVTAKTAARDAAKKTLDDAQKAVDDAQTALQKAITDAGNAITDGPLDLNDYNPPAPKSGLMALENTDLFNILCLPPDLGTGDIPSSLWDTAAAYCQSRRAMLVVDPPNTWTDKDSAKAGIDVLMTRSANAAVFFPSLLELDQLRDNQEFQFAPCGAMAGLFARMASARGVWKAPAGIDATILGTSGLAVPLTDGENGELNPLGINCLRDMRTIGRVIWGSRTLRGADALTDEYKYIPVRRTALYIEESLFRGTKWVVFEPNDEPLWAQIRLNVGAFMNTLFRQGAFQGTKPSDAYLVKCDHDTNPQTEIDKGIVNILVGFAPLKPAEFVVINIQQLTGQISV
jgi:phage tail sheath protein FI